MMKTTTTPYGTIYSDGDRDWFAGSEEELRTAKAWAYFQSGNSSLSRESALAAQRDEEEAQALPLPEAD